MADKSIYNILVVEDDEGNAALIRRSFEVSGMPVNLAFALSLQEAKAAIKQTKPDLTIADYMLPDGKGSELLPGSGITPHYPIVLMTSYGDERVAVEAMKAGAFDYIKKTPESLSNISDLSIRILREWDHILIRREAEQALHDSEEKFHAIFNQSSDSILLTDPDDRAIVDFNDNAHKRLGYTREDFSNLRVSDIVVDASEPSLKGRAEKILHSEKETYSVKFRKRDGATRDVSVTAKKVSVKGKDYILSTVQDITEKKEAEEFRRLSTSVFETACEAIMVCDIGGKILTTNRAFSKITGYSSQEVIGRNPRFLQSGRHDKAFYQAMWDLLKNKGYWSGEIWNRKKNGEIFPEWLSISSVKGEQGEIVRYAALFSDITKRKQDEEQLHFQAYYDPLTALPNRVLMFERIAHAIKLSRRRKGMTALLFVDLDRFKQVNDTVGHIGGDAVLRQTADRLRHCVRGSDTVGRSGGDEFLIVLPEIEGREMPAMIGRLILETLSHPFMIEGQSIILGASIGIAVAPDDGDVAAVLLKHADMALHTLKGKGRNAIRFFNEKIEKAARTRALLEWDLRRALDNQEFVLHYQPVIDMVSMEIITLEALIRWNHPEKGLLSPGEFIALAEESDLIEHIGQWVLQSACSQVKQWQDRWGYNGSVNVNVSTRQILYGNFRSILMEALEKSALPPKCLTLEVTESLMLDEGENAIGKLEEFKALGVKLAMDDFGTGYSSLSYLARYPIDILKIDRAFISKLPSDKRNQPLVEAIIRMGQSMNMKIVAEGVETETEFNYLKSAGCGEAQGYYFSRPLSVEDYEKVLKQIEGIESSGFLVPSS